MIGLNSIIIDETSRHRQCGGSPDTGAVFRRHAGLRRLHGTYTYQTARPHAVMSVSNTDNRIGKTQQDITYGPLGKAVSIADGSARLTLSYGPDRQRWRSRSARKWRTDTLTVETLHDGGYERVTTEDGTVREFHRLGRGLVCVVTDGGSPLVLCALTDNVGSYVQMAFLHEAPNNTGDIAVIEQPTDGPAVAKGDSARIDTLNAITGEVPFIK